MNNKRVQKQIRHKRVVKKIKRAGNIHRLVVFRSNKFIYAQLIDDSQSKTLASATDATIKEKKSKVENAKEVGKSLAKSALAKNVKKIVFDRGGYKYHGRIKALAEGAREGGLTF